jgi:hypothetical protein
MRCLEKDRARRYDTANGLAMDIQRHLNNEPVLARPPSAWYRYQKAWHRHKAAFTAGAAVVATLIVGLGLSLWQATMIDRERDRAVASEIEAVAQAEAADRERRRAEPLERSSSRRAYAADMNLVQRALQMNDLGRAKRLLDRYRPAPGEEDLRGWEWRYLWKQVQSDALYSLPSVAGPVYSLAACPQGRWLAVAGDDQEVSLWDLRSRERSRTLIRHGGILDRHSAAFDQTLASLGFENFAKLATSPTHPWLPDLTGQPRLVGQPAIEFLRGLFSLIRGIRIQQHIVEGAYCVTPFDLDTIHGTIPVLDRFHVEDGKLKLANPFYDPRPITNATPTG